MKTLKRFASWLRNNKGVATSLVEATATVAIGPTLASVAVRSDKASSPFIKTIRFSHCSSTEGDPQKGWAGPYVIALPKTDPWGDKYIINVRNLHSGYLKTLSGSSSRLPKLAVIVLSAGLNRNIETRVDQSFDSFSAAGDDVVFRVK